MAKRRTSRKTARQNRPAGRLGVTSSLYRRTLRYEPLEDRRLLALVTVTTLNDSVDFGDGFTSLREAIFATNLVGGPDTIDFAPSLTPPGGPVTLSLTQGQLSITDDITIDGPGWNRLIINAQQQSRIFDIPSTGVEVTIEGLTLTGGRTTGNNPFGGPPEFSGGAIRSLSNERLTLVDVKLGGNSTTGTNARGGAIFSLGPVTLNQSIVAQNSANAAGSGIYATALVTLNQTSVSGNTATVSSRAGASAITVDGNDIVLNDSVVSYNAVRAIVARNVTLTGSEVRANAGEGISGQGSVVLVDSAITGNAGTGIFSRFGSPAVVSLLRSTMSSNAFGAIVSLGAHVILTDSSITDHETSTSFTAGIVSQGGDVTLNNSTIANNRALYAGARGAAIYANGDVTLNQSTVSGNTSAGSGGGIYGLRNITVRYSTLTENSAAHYGGAILGRFSGLTIDIRSSIVAGNSATLGSPDIHPAETTLNAHHSLIGNNDGTSLVEAPVGSPDANGNLIGGPMHGFIDPLLGPLADNGGPTLTYAFLVGSPAINRGDLNAVAGVDGVPLYDQRGEPFGRVFNGRIDIGAFEYQSPSDLNLLVDTLADESDGDYSRFDLSLREAIALANLWPSTDTIHFDPILTGGTILLTMGELQITDDVSIVGLGADLLTIDASGNDPTPDVNNGDGRRIFNIDNHADSQIEVSITGLRLTGGDANGMGGAILNREILTVTHASIVDNASRGTSSAGGAIANVSAHLTVIESTIQGNSASVGRIAAGGGIYSTNGVVTINDSHLSGNTATSGGAIYAWATHLDVSQITITGGTANRGGGILARGSDVNITDSAITGNTSMLQGGGAYLSTVTGGTAIVSNTTFTGNSTHPASMFGQGGGLFVTTSSEGSILIENSTFTKNAAFEGGAVSASGTNIVISGCTMKDNTSTRNAGAVKLSVATGGTATISDSEFESNSTTQGGFATPAPRGFGGGLYVTLNNGSRLAVEDCSFVDNIGTHGAGIGVQAQGMAQFEIKDTSISHNSGSGFGGGLYAHISTNAELLILNSTLSENTAYTGGGIWARADSDSELVVRDSTINHNTAATTGGGVTATLQGGSQALFEQSTISGNTATMTGGGIQFHDYAGGATAFVRHSTVTDNSSLGLAPDTAGGVRISGLDIQVHFDHTIVAGNHAVAGVSPDVFKSNTASLTAEYSLLGIGTTTGLAETMPNVPDSNGNLVGGPIHGVIDPLLGTLADNGGPTFTHALLPGSPAINRGDLNAVAGVDEVPLYDQRDEPFGRVVNGRIDIGAFEYQSPSDLNLLVDTLADELDGDYSRFDLSLREAIALANLWPSTDTIHFDPLLTGGTILLTMGELKITDDVSIIGLGADQLTIDASGNDPTPDVNDGKGTRIFNIDNATSSSFLDVSLSGMTLTGGDVSGQGGAIHILENLSLNDVHLVHNASSGFGGALNARLSDLGTASDPGPAHLSIVDSVISHNTGRQGRAFGGGIAVEFRSDGLFSIDSTIISDNSSTSIGGGGWITIDRGTLQITDSQIARNTAANTGGGLSITLSQQARLELDNTSIEQNTTPSRGGGMELLLNSASSAFVTNSTISGNTTQNSGGGFYARIDSASELSIDDSEISGNTARFNGGGASIFVLGGSTTTINITTISNNSAIAELTTASKRGGGLYLRATGTSHIDMEHLTIAGNTAGREGGGFYATLEQNSDFDLVGSTVSGNSSTLVAGGMHLRVSNSSTALVHDSTIDHNTSSSAGGASVTLLSGGSATFEQVTVSGNSAFSTGGLRFSEDSLGGPAIVRHSTITDNTAMEAFAGNAGGMNVNGGNLEFVLEHTIIAGNHIVVGSPDLRIAPTVDVAASYNLIGDGTGSRIAETSPNVPDANGNLVGGPTHGVIDPLLGPLTDNGGPTHTHALFANSPATNMGDLNAVGGADGVPKFDQRGMPFLRVVNGRIDIGAFEFQTPSDLNLLVDTLTDELDHDYSRGDLSLREALFLANKYRPSDNYPDLFDTIRFDPILTTAGPATIRLTLGELQIFDDVTILGPGADLLTVDASGNDTTPDVIDGKGSRVVLIAGANPTVPTNVTIAGLTFTGGDKAAEGGAISSKATNLLLQAMEIVDNAASRGGGVSFGGGHLVLAGTIVGGNSVFERGGGVHATMASVTIDGSTISGNTAQVGGGVYFQDFDQSANHQLTITSSTIAGNQARNNGGGVWARGMGGAIVIQQSTFSGNTAGQPQFSGSGGGLYANLTNVAMTIAGSSLQENVASSSGGGASLRLFGGTLVVEDSHVVRNRVNGGEARGGGLHLTGQTATATLRNSTITENSTTANFAAGGGIAVDGNRLIVESSTISGNSAARAGGGIYSFSHLEIRDSTISGNSAQFGAGLNHRSQSLVIDRTTISSNTATMTGGGGYIGSRSSPVTITGSTIDNNSAALMGGGLLLTSINATIDSSTFSGNSAGQDGGAIRNGGATTNIRHSTITDNTAGRGGGLQGGTFVLGHTIVAGNHGPGNIADDIAATTVNANYSLIGTNAGTPLAEAPVNSPDSKGNLIGGPTHGVIDPRLEPLADFGGPTRTHAPLAGSPTINRGDLSAVAGAGGVPLYDQRGEPFGRIVGGRIDIGSFEFQFTSDLNLYVDTLADESDGNHARGDLSLREAIELANAYKSPPELPNEFAPPISHTIRFDPALAGGTILLTMGELTIENNVEFIGLGADQLTIDASGNDPTPDVNNNDGSRIFNVLPPAPGLVVTLSGLTLTGGDVALDLGGAILAPSPADLIRLTDMVIRDNAGFYGGAIYGNYLEITRSYFIRNHAAAGGAIIGGDMTIVDSFLNENTATHSGGAIYYGGSAAITNSQFIGNYAGDEGGAIDAFGDLTVHSSVFRNNRGVSRGGAIHHGGAGIFTVFRTIIENNVSDEIPNTIIGVGAKRGGEGGGIYTGSNQIVEIVESRIVGNNVTGTGGGLYLSGGTKIIDRSTISDNYAARGGGGLRLFSGNLSILDSTISGNRSGMSGGGIQSDFARLQVYRSTIGMNVAATFGGGLAYGRDILLNHTILATNTASTGPDLRSSSPFQRVITSHFSVIGNQSGTSLVEAPIGSPDATGNLIGGPTHGVIDPRLAPLADNGGPTHTHALLPESPAINAGDPAALPGVNGVPLHDQRGAPFTRVAGGRIDIGAFERQVAAGLAGDFNHDNVVDTADYIVLRKQMGLAVAPGTGADANGDGMVNSADHAVWASNVGRTTVAQAVASTVQEVQTPQSLAGSESSAGDTRSAPSNLLAVRRVSQSSNGGRRVAVPSSSDAERADRALVAWTASQATLARSSQRWLSSPAIRRLADDAANEQISQPANALDRAFALLGVHFI